MIDDNPQAPQYLLDKLAFSIDSEIRQKVARHPNTSVEILSQLIGDVVEFVRQAVRENPKTPASLIEEIKTVYYNACYSTSATELANLANTPWHFIHVAVASNIHTSVTTLEGITTKKIAYLIEDCSDLKYLCLQTIPTLDSLANNPSTPEHILNQLLTLLINEDNGSEIAKQLKSIKVSQGGRNIDRNTILKGIASHHNASDGILDRLSNNQDYIIRLTVAENNNTSVSLLSKLIKDNDREVRQAAIKNYLNKYPQGLLEILEIYGNKYQSRIVRLLALLHPQVPEKILIKNSRSLYWLESYAVAANPNTPDFIKQQLSKDGNSIVHTATIR